MATGPAPDPPANADEDLHVGAREQRRGYYQPGERGNHSVSTEGFCFLEDNGASLARG